MKVIKTGKRIKVTDDDREGKNAAVAKHKNKKFSDLTQAEKDELLLVLLQQAGLANKNGKIK